MKNVVGLFDNIRDAEAVVRELRSAGVSDTDISFAGRNTDAATMESNEYVGEGHSEAAEGAGFGATGGTIVGGLTGLLVGLGALVIPGVGPVIAAGTLATALGSAALGAGIGAATGGLLGALVGAGIPEEDAHVYSEGIRRGGALVMAKVDDTQVETTLDIMERHDVVDIDERGTSYRETGWSSYDESAGPYTGTTSSTIGSSTVGDADRLPDSSDYDRSSKAGTAGGALAGAATGAAIGSAGGPIGTVIGGVAGAVTGGGIGAAGDAAGVEASDSDRGGSSRTTGTTDSSYSSVDTGYRGAGDPNTTLDSGDYDRSSKVGTAGGGLAGAATGAAIGSAGGPIGTVIGGVAGAVTGGGIGAAGDAAGAEASDNDSRRSSYDSTSSTSGTAYGSTTGRRRTRTYDASDTTMNRTVGGGTVDSTAQRITEATERGLDADLDRDGDVGRRDSGTTF